MRVLIIICSIILWMGCNEQKNNPNKGLTVNESQAPPYNEVQTGNTKIITADGRYKVWTKKAGSGDIKVLLLHGGSGLTHDYFESFEEFLLSAGIELYYYDKLGAGNSYSPDDTSLWNLPRFVEEVDQVRRGLGLENFYLLGLSWGSLLAMEYLHKYQDHVKAAVLSNMTAGMKNFTGYPQKLKQELFARQEIKKFDSLDRLHRYEDPAHQKLLMKLYSNIVCRLDPWLEPLMRSLTKTNTSIFSQMWGTDEFHVTGNLKNWEMWDRLSNIRIPTLVIGGEKDEMNPEDMRKEGKLIPNSRTYLCPGGSHMAMYDDQQNYFNSLITFLKDVEEKKFKPDLK